MGETRFLAGGNSVEFRANVAILSSNVVIQGESTFSRLDRHGAQIFLHSRTHPSIADQSKGNSLTARIENIEVRYAGQFGRLGRYPLHFHMSGKLSNSYVRKTRIHHTYHRCIVLHGVHYLRVQDNVCFENMGHALFIEDGVEAKNVIKNNLIFGTRPCFSCLNSDFTPASYWLVNGDNYVEHNIAAGSTNYGFWFFPERHVRGASGREKGSENICPPNVPLLRFADNEAHNNMAFGFRISGESGFVFGPRRNPCKPVSKDNPYQTSEFLRLYAWRNGHNGFFIASESPCTRTSQEELKRAGKCLTRPDQCSLRTYSIKYC